MKCDVLKFLQVLGVDPSIQKDIDTLTSLVIFLRSQTLQIRLVLESFLLCSLISGQTQDLGHKS